MKVNFSYTILEEDCDEYGFVNEWVMPKIIYNNYDKLVNLLNEKYKLLNSNFEFILPVKLDDTLQFNMEKLENQEGIILKTFVYNSNNDLVNKSDSLFSAN